MALVLLIAFWILAGVQAGKQREKDGIILRRIDRLPTELEVVGFLPAGLYSDRGDDRLGRVR